MATKLEILEFFSNRACENIAVNNKILMKKFDLSASAVSHWLSRLKKQGIIEFKSSPQLGEYYLLTEKGKKRLQILRKRDRKTEKNDKSAKSFWERVFDTDNDDDDDDMF